MQNDPLSPLASRVVIPLRSPLGFGTPARGLNPGFEVNNVPVLLDTAVGEPVYAITVDLAAQSINGGLWRAFATTTGRL